MVRLCSLEVGVCSPHTVLYFIFLAPLHKFHREKTTTQALFSYSYKGFWIPVSCSQVALYFSLQRHMSSLSFPSQISSVYWMNLARDKSMCCLESTGWAKGPQDYTCATAAPVYRLCPSFVGLLSGPPNCFPCLWSNLHHISKISFRNTLLLMSFPYLSPFSGATLKIKSNLICMAYRICKAWPLATSPASSHCHPGPPSHCSPILSFGIFLPLYLMFLPPAHAPSSLLPVEIPRSTVTTY